MERHFVCTGSMLQAQLLPSTCREPAPRGAHAHLGEHLVGCILVAWPFRKAHMSLCTTSVPWGLLGVR